MHRNKFQDIRISVSEYNWQDWQYKFHYFGTDQFYIHHLRSIHQDFVACKYDWICFFSTFLHSLVWSRIISYPFVLSNEDQFLLRVERTVFCADIFNIEISCLTSTVTTKAVAINSTVDSFTCVNAKIVNLNITHFTIRIEKD